MILIKRVIVVSFARKTSIINQKRSILQTKKKYNKMPNVNPDGTIVEEVSPQVDEVAPQVETEEIAETKEEDKENDGDYSGEVNESEEEEVGEVV